MVINIYSVLIQTKETLNNFETFRELFLYAIEKNDIGICEWNIWGEDVESALPGLVEMVDDKEEWKAIIVLDENPSDKSTLTSNNCENPFDFISGTAENNDYYNDSIPLVRLTHILGGIPAPEIEFSCQEINEEGKAARVVYKPEINEENARIYRELSEKYSYNGKRPSEIYVISLRNITDLHRQYVSKPLSMQREMSGLRFWKNNRYPSICRFLVFDVSDEGKNSRNEALFKFWISIMLLAVNDIAVDTLQAYRLYAVSPEFDKKKMKSAFIKLASNLYGANEYIKGTILSERLTNLENEDVKPEFSVHVEANCAIDRGSVYTVNPGEFSVVADSIGSELNMWKTMDDDITQNFSKTYRHSIQELEKAGESIRNLYTYPESDIHRVTEFKRREIEEDLNEQKKGILYMQSRFAKGDKNFLNKSKEKAGIVKDAIMKRVKRESAMRIAALACLAVIISILPGIIFSVKKQIEVAPVMLISGAIIAGIMLLVEFGIFVKQKKDFNSLIADYNKSSLEELYFIQKNTEKYSAYLSAIVTNSRGEFFLDALDNNNEAKHEDMLIQEKYLYAIEGMIEKLRTWSTANYLDVNFEGEFYEEMVIENGLSISQMLLKVLDVGEFETDLNYTGDVIKSPFNFIRRLSITREEIYDDV